MINKIGPNILVTGCNGDIAYSILKILREHFPYAFIIGVDCSPEGIGQYKFDVFKTIPAANSSLYINTIENFLTEYKIEHLIPCTEPEIKVLNSATNKLISGSLITVPKNITDICFDKYETSRFLQSNGLPHIRSCLGGNIDYTLKLPVIIKPRRSSGSRNLQIVNNLESLSIAAKNLSNEHIVQEFIQDENEYTSCIFSDGNEYRVITLKRKLRYGLTFFAEVVNLKNVDNFLVNIAKKLNPLGSINVQFKIIDDTPLVFEINPRFSSTVYYRHMLGFKDLIWALELKCNKAISPAGEIKNLKFHRYFEDILS